MGHSFASWERFLIIFGGQGAYNTQSCSKSSYNDVVAFDTVSKKSMGFNQVSIKYDVEDPLKQKFRNTSCANDTKIDFENFLTVR